MPKTLRMLFVDNDVNSFVAYRLEVARAAREAGYEVHVAAPRGQAEVVLRREKLLFHAIPMTRRGLNPFREAATVMCLFRLYRRLRPDLVHHLRLKPVFYGGMAANLADVPAVVNMLTGLGHVFTSDGLKARTLRAVIKLGCRTLAFNHRRQRVIFQNPDDRSVFVSKNHLVPLEQSALIRGSGVDVNDFQPQPEPPGPPLVVLAARMLRDKGVHEFVEAAEWLRAQGISARFALVGDTDIGNPTAISRRELESWQAQGIVEWWGHRSDIYAVLSGCHVVCLPSYREGVPKVLIEAAACGRPIVTTDAPGCREIVTHGQNGLLVPPRDSRSLAGALLLLIENPDLRQRMGKRGREIAVSDFSMDRVVKATLGIYDELLAA